MENRHVPLLGKTGNLRHILTTGLPPGVEREDIDDPGAKALHELRGVDLPAGLEDADDIE